MSVWIGILTNDKNGAWTEPLGKRMELAAFEGERVVLEFDVPGDGVKSWWKETKSIRLTHAALFLDEHSPWPISCDSLGAEKTVNPGDKIRLDFDPPTVRSDLPVRVEAR